MLNLPILFFKFWFIEAPYSLIRNFYAFDKKFLDLLSFSLLLKTFFKPLKNEYRKGLVGFSIGMGILVKSFLLFFESVLVLGLLYFQTALVIIFIFLPFLAFVILLL